MIGLTVIGVNCYSLTGSNHLRIAGNFRMVQTFAVFADGPTTAKIKTANVYMD